MTLFRCHPLLLLGRLLWEHNPAQITDYLLQIPSNLWYSGLSEETIGLGDYADLFRLSHLLWFSPASFQMFTSSQLQSVRLPTLICLLCCSSSFACCANPQSSFCLSIKTPLSFLSVTPSVAGSAVCFLSFITSLHSSFSLSLFILSLESVHLCLPCPVSSLNPRWRWCLFFYSLSCAWLSHPFSLFFYEVGVCAQVQLPWNKHLWTVLVFFNLLFLLWSILATWSQTGGAIKSQRWKPCLSTENQVTSC